jgi:uncharacterized SAM-binding protein YcdF (DUF218 family)
MQARRSLETRFRMAYRQFGSKRTLEVCDTVSMQGLRFAVSKMLATLLRPLPKRVSVAAVLASLLIIGALPATGNPLLLRALESQYPAWTDKGGAPPSGIIVVGGGLATYLAAVKEGSEPPGPGQRVVAGIALAKRFPNSRLLFTGGGEPSPITALARAGIDPGRILVESRSRNTAENAAFLSSLVQPRPDERWILVTSAYHMPRAIGSFRTAGFAVEAYPVDYLANVPKRDQEKWAEAAWKEIFGLIAYRLSGRIGFSK